MKIISLRLPDSLIKRLDITAAKRGCKKSEVVRDALEAYFSNGECPDAPSAYDLSRDFIGIIDDPNVPSDLATNPKWMEGYGR